MQLYFLRHGKAASRSTSTTDDAARPLTDEGREETRRAARGLAALDLGIERIVTSPFVRARETAALTAEKLGLPVEEADELAAGCDLDGLARVLGRLASAQQVMLVGHEPDFSTLIGLLIAGRQGVAVLLKKGACCRVDLPDRAAESAADDARKLLGKGELVWLMTTKQLALMAPGETPAREATTPSGDHSDRSKKRPKATPRMPQPE
jgi:phosphohistidine phosphatase